MKRKVLNLMKVTLFVLMWMGYLCVSAQDIAVKGTVTDTNGESLIGVTIQVQGTTIGTITDIDGRFVLQNIPSNSILEVSYVGMLSRTIALEGKTTIDIVLQEDTEILDEIIVIGYGTAKRKDFTGSVSSVKLENSPVALTSNLNALEAIKGNVSGLDIGATNSAGGQPSMQMRGQKSISGSNDPLIVLDGVIFMGNINDINPNDIASFDILKDATSAAAYGSRSANGVIIITTKKGRSAKPVITFNASGSLQSWMNRPKLMNGEQWLESVMARNNSTDLTWLKPQEAANREARKEINWLDASTRTGWIQDYQLSVSGSGEKMNYYLSGSYANNQGVVIGDDYHRVSVLGKINTDITSWLELGADAAYTKSDYSGVGAALNQAFVMSPYGVMYRDEENKLLEKFPYTQSGQNPLWGVTNGSRDNTDLRDNFRLNAYAVVKMPWLPGFSYRFNYAGNVAKEHRTNFYYESHYVKEGAYDDATRYSPAAYQNLLSNANGNIDNRSISSWVIDNILNYTATFDKHSIDLTAVATRDRRDYKRENTTGNDFAANGNTTLGVNGLHKATVQKILLEGDRRANIGYLGRASYSYDEKYYLTGSYRRDGASVFGVNQKWGDFMAFGSAWRITNESFMKNVNILDDLKLKLSWGKNGNQGLSPYGTLSTIRNGAEGGARYQFGNSSNILYGMVPGALGNADLGWESTESWNTGFESVWLNNRIFFDVDVYFSKTTDQIFERNIPVMTGFKTIKSSLGQINNRGIEMTLRTVNIAKHDFTWTTGITFWLNRNKLAHLYGEDLDGDGKEDDDISNSRFIGKPLGAIYGYVQDGIVQESDTEYMQKNGVSAGVPKYRDLDGDGVITAEDRDILGYTTPNFKLNMSNTLTYKNIDLYMMLTGTFGGGGYYFKENREAFMTNGSGLFNSNSIYIPWWTPENKSNKYPSAVFAGDGGRFRGLQNRGFVRLQDVTLSYSFGEPWVKNLNIQNLKVFLTAKNLFTITDWEGDDPEVGSAVRENTYPVLTSFSLGANISF
ncbi:TonB-dependent receptor [uncultured Proteiniphilum sp.]|uniref:SusC/RagA family TonB-linked outer membrane protein n=1 Tax=uncultured Proteiniphilum sp. TaxID=497637 RepID=UPI00262F5342|nr:TonB-dependent receptor [uncultured Proteiniphilum sp.]